MGDELEKTTVKWNLVKELEVMKHKHIMEEIELMGKNKITKFKR